jgi:4'-phosphopantetheinyl transferase
MLLADTLQQHPAQIQIARTDLGKPYLPDYPQFVFNISHTDNQLAFAIARHCQLGIDIERLQLRNNFSSLVARCFADEEAAYWHNLSADQKTAVFYQFWTKKEAFVKATGRGIALGLKECVVNPWQPETFLRIPEGCGAVANWRIVGLDEGELATGLCGSVVVDTRSSEIRKLPEGIASRMIRT